MARHNTSQSETDPYGFGYSMVGTDEIQDERVSIPALLTLDSSMCKNRRLIFHKSVSLSASFQIILSDTRTNVIDTE